MTQMHPSASYKSPLADRYASKEMQKLFSPQFKYSTWRRLWLALAQAEAELGLPITPEQLSEMQAHLDDIDFEAAAAYEKKLHHDVMAHIHAYGDQCPKAKSIIHLGATSCFVTDNTDLIQMRAGLLLLIQKLRHVLQQLATFSKEHADVACLGFTHFQPAQLTTVGKRTCLWMQDFLCDLNEMGMRVQKMRFLGAKGSTGTQASFLNLFSYDHNKVEKLDQLISKKMGFSNYVIISGQTYSRKLDALILNSLSGIGISAHKFGTDFRLLSHLNELEEPHAESQVGSSAMPYKRNPILSERICALSRFLISLSENSSYTAATQWLERSLDDSANRRLCLPEAFLTADAILELLLHLTSNIAVYPKIIARHVAEELPFMATENILMTSVKKGGDRQALHEKIRKYSQVTTQRIKEEGLENNLLNQIAADPAFNISKDELTKLVNVADFIGRAPQQVEEFLSQELLPQLEKIPSEV